MAAPRELRSVRDVRDAARGDALVLWAASELTRGTRAFTAGGAVAVAAPGLSRRDRLAVCGPPADAEALVRTLLPRLGPTFRPIGGEHLIRHLATRLPQLEFLDAFGWMQTETPTARRVRAKPTPDHGTRPQTSADRQPQTETPTARSGKAEGDGEAPREAITTGHAIRARETGGAAWLTESDLPDVASLLTDVFPTSHAHPDRSGPHRWAGVRDASGALLACAADAWSAPGVGYLAGVATAVRARGRGVGADVCGFVLDALVAEHGVAALIVDTWNTPAVRLYRELGLSWRPAAAARVADR